MMFQTTGRDIEVDSIEVVNWDVYRLPFTKQLGRQKGNKWMERIEGLRCFDALIELEE